MREAQRTKAADTAGSSRERILCALQDLGIDFRANVWRSRYEMDIRLDWELFFRERSFRAHAHPSLAPTYKWIAACWLTGCGDEVARYGMATVRGRLYAVRQAFHSFKADADSLPTLTPRQVQNAVRTLHRTADRSSAPSKQTVHLVLDAVQDMYRLRRFLPSALSCDPFPPAFVRSALADTRPPERWSAPPEPVCLELIRQAIRMIGTPADEIIRLRERYVLACEAAKRLHGRSIKRIIRQARAALSGERFSTLPGEAQPWTHLPAASPVSLKQLVAALEGACALVLLFLSGPRVSELRRASLGCVRHIVHANGIAYPYFIAQRSKRGGRRARSGNSSPSRIGIELVPVSHRY
jgi:hypothetical protein